MQAKRISVYNQRRHRLAWHASTCGQRLYFDGKYIEFANATNNLDKIATKVINMPTSSLRQDVGTTNDFMSSSTIDGNYEQKGKSYHLYTFGALCNQARNKNATFVGTDFPIGRIATISIARVTAS